MITRQKLYKMDGFCAYRFPKANKIHLYKGIVADGIKEGFVIAPFDIAVSSFLTITSLNEADWTHLDSLVEKDDSAYRIFKMPEVSTTENEHAIEVENIIKEIKSNPTHKTIAAKATCRIGSIDIEKSFDSLCDAFPDAFVFSFYTPRSGAWIGASPELLLKGDKSGLDTVALAGTRPAGDNTPWDDKNKTEQAIVANYIEVVFNRYGLNPTLSLPVTHKAGNVEHLLTGIHGDLLTDENNFIPFLKRLSPTPALCGFPKEESMDRIKRLENFERGFYGGFCGIYNSMSDFSFYVILRSVMFDSLRWCLISGGGITSESNPKTEWSEAERKAFGIIDRLKFKSNIDR